MLKQDTLEVCQRKAPPLLRSSGSSLRHNGVVMSAMIFLVALNLRPALTSVGPLLPVFGPELGLGESLQGLLGSLPIFAFAAVSPFVYLLTKRVGMDRSVFITLMLLAIGLIVRSYVGLPGLWAGTVIVGLAIGIGNVLVPTIVKRDFSTRVSKATGLYSACITVAASIASAVAVPMSGWIGWQASLAVWAALAIVIALLWLPRTRSGVEADADQGNATAFPSVWRQPVAWYAAIFMGLQSTGFYFMITWLPTIEVASGTGKEQAGLHLFAYQIVGIGAALAAPLLMRRGNSQTLATVVTSIPMLVALSGILVLPELSLLWVLVAGLGSGGSLAVALSIIGLRGRTDLETTKLSGMAQSFGYLLAALGPLLAGVLTDVTGGWNAALIAMIGVSAVQLLIAAPAGRGRKT